jgi:FG-GAP-like repeat/Abnormal spindle-like microcephaly-assoc'd, ASPM-SPD-2-Hydin/FG-GAP repeat
MRTEASYRAVRVGVVFLFLTLVGVFSPAAFAENPVPVVNQPLVPDATPPGGPEFTLTVNGTGFVSGSVVNWNTTALATQFISGSQLTATVPAADIATASTASVTVVNPAPGGGTSNVAFFTVAANTADSLAFYLASSPATASVPAAVAVGDFNGDGKLDLAVANECGSGPSCDSSGTVSILLGNGTGNFTLASSPAVGEHPVSVAVGDFNGDGKLDLAVANNGSNTVSILLGDGNGNFTLASSVDTGNNPSSGVVGDFNGDGKLDLAVGNGSISILLGDGTGNFTLFSSLAGVGTPAVVGDFNGDGKLDLAVVSSGSKVSILLGDGTGHFSLASSPAVGKVPVSVAVGDFNGDGKLDLAVADFYSSTVSVLLGDGTGHFTLDASPATGPQPESVAVGDFNGDGKLDLAVPNLSNTVSILLQGPTATLSLTGLSFGPQLALTTSGPQTVTLSNTGSTPLIITSIATSGDFAQTNTCGVSVEFGASCTISVTFTPTAAGTRVGAITIIDNAATSRQIVDLTGTGLLSGPSATLMPTSLAFSNQPAHTTSTPQTVTLTNAGATTLSITSIVATGDFAETNTCGNSLASDASCSISVTFRPTETGTRTGSVTVTDNAPGSPQSVLLTGSNSTLAQNPVPLINQPLVPDATAPGGSQFVLRVNGTGFVSGSVVTWNGGALATQFISSSHLTATVPAADIATASTASVTVLNPAPGGGTSNVAFFPVTANEGNDVSFVPAPLPTTGGVVAVGDFNGDGNLDLAVGSGGGVSILLGDGTGNFVPISCPGCAVIASAIAVGDFNGDGKLDLAVAAPGEVNVLLGDGTGNFTLASLLIVGYANFSTASVAVGDFNGDGNLDLATTFETQACGVLSTGLSVYLGDGTGRNFGSFGFPSYSIPSPATGPLIGPIAVGDFNGDGKLDLAVAGNSAISILLGDGTGNFTLASSVALADTSSMVLGDFNGDGKLDLAVTNGTVSILLGDGTGNFTLSSSLAGVGTAVALGDFNGDGKLDLAVTYGGDTVSILLGDGTGNFTPASLSTGGDLASSVAVGDFNGDGKLDLAMPGLVLLQPSPLAALSPTSLTFAEQLVYATSGPQTVTLANPGSAPLIVTSIAASGDFAQTNTCGSSVAAGASCVISITFTPTAPGTRTGTITINDNAPGSPQTVSLTGSGVIPGVTLSPTTLSFRAQFVSTISGPQAVMLTNTGTATLIITSLAASGDFAQTNTCGSSVAAGASCTISVTFSPTQAGTTTGTIRIKDDATGSPQVVPLTGIGTAVSLSTTSLTFPGQNVGTTTTGQNVTLTNHGSSSLSITSVATTGDFTAGKLCPLSIKSQGRCSIFVLFKPTQTGARTGTLTITDSDPGSPQVVVLTGTGTAPEVGLSVASLSFASQLVGTSSAAQTVTLTNTGDGPLTISSITASGDFGSTPGKCAGTVAAGASCEITVVFKPQAGGSRTGNLSITDDAAGSPQTLALSGTGQDFAISASTTSATVTAGQTASYTLSLASQGGFSGPLSLTCTGAPTAATCSLAPSSVTLAASGATPVTVRVTTTARSLAPPATHHRPLGLGSPRVLLLLALLIVTLLPAWTLTGFGRPKRGHLWAALGATLFLVMLWVACGAGGGTTGLPVMGTPAGTYPLIVAARGSGVTNSVSLTLTVN